MKTVLLNPGPVILSSRVRKAMEGPDLCHREPEFIHLQSVIRDKLLDIYGLSSRDWASILLTGSGTAAMEAMISSIPGDNDSLLIIQNGVYGERLGHIAEVHGVAAEFFHHEWEQPVDCTALESKLSGVSYIVVVHHETTTGRLNDLATIAEIATRHGIPLLIDGISSFGAEEIRFKEWGIAACAGTANKCLHGAPGTSFVIANRRYLNNDDNKARTLYLDLSNYLEKQDAGDTPFTQSVQTIYALAAALDEHQEGGGWQARRETYRQRMTRARGGLVGLGIRPLLDETDCSCVLHAYHLPEGITYTELHDRLKDEGFIIYAGQGKLAKSIFRISMMGEISLDDVERFVESVRKIVRR